MLALYEPIEPDPCLLHPEATARVIFDIVMAILVFIEMLVIPVTICFPWRPPRMYDLATTAVFVVDVILNFRTGFYYYGTMVMKGNVIAYHYMKTTFLLDVIATVPWDYVFQSETGGRCCIFDTMKIGHYG